MFVNLYNRNFTVFLADATEEMADIRQDLKYVLVKARIQIIDGEGVV
jgi:hypothetical protein